MRNRIYILITLVCISLVSCVKELEIDPLQNIDASVALETSEDINAALIGAYGILHGGSLYGNNLNLVPELLGSSGYCQWRGTFQSFRQMMNKSITIVLSFMVGVCRVSNICAHSWVVQQLQRLVYTSDWLACEYGRDSNSFRPPILQDCAV